MITKEQILEQINHKYAEWIEELGPHAPEFIIDRLAHLLIEEKNLNNYYRNRLEHVNFK